MKHTPGPWATSRDAVPAHHVQITVYAEADGQRVATVFREAANAHLIARAPRMLEILERIAASCEAMLAGDDCDPYDMAEAILADARDALRL